MRCVIPWAALALAACQPPHAADVEHTLDEPVRATSRALWADIAPEAMMSLLAGPQAYLASDDLAVARLQFWADRMYEHWLTRKPREVIEVPRPRVIVERRASVNAFVSQRLRCFAVPFESRAQRVERAEQAPFVRVYPSLGAEIVFQTSVPATERFCEKRSNEPGLVRPYLEALNEQLASIPGMRCRFRLEKGLVTGSASCPWRREAAFEGAGGIILPVTSNVVTVHAGSFLKLDEPELVALLAHELGHFFKADVSRPRRASGFFYELEERNPPRRPEPTRDPHLQALGSALTELTNVPLYQPLPGRRFHPNVFYGVLENDVYKKSRTFVDELGERCAGRKCEKSCGDFVRLWTDMSVQEALHRDGYPEAEGSELAGDDVLVYRRVEEALARCSAQVDPREEFAAGRDARAYVARALAREVFRITETRIETHPVVTLLGVLQAASRAYEKAHGWAEEGRERARELRLGWYTHEQEADDFALEQISALGFPAKAHVELLWKFARESAEAGENDFSYEECRAASERGWRAPDGRSELVPLGPWGVAHHGNCYRIFNAEREIEAHRYMSTQQQPVAPGGSWAEVSEHVRSLLGAP